MEIFQKLILSLNQEEQRTYKLLCGRSHSKEMRKDLALYNYTRKAAKMYDESYILGKLYGPGITNKNALYRLKNKVKSDIQRSLNYLNFDESAKARIMNCLILYNHFVERKDYELAAHYLKRGEETAKETEDYRLLDLIYTITIELSQQYEEINPLDYIQLKRANEKKISLQNTMDEIYSSLNYQLKKSFNYSQGKFSGTQLINKLMNDYGRAGALKNIPAFRYKIFKTVAQALVQRHDYPALVKYTRENLELFTRKGWLGGADQDLKLQMLVYICNGLYKQGKYFESLKYADTLKREIEDSEAPLKGKYHFFYTYLLIYNYTMTDPHAAIKLCNESLRELKQNNNPQLEYVMLINKAVAQNNANLYDDAIGTLNLVFINDYFRKSDAAFKMKIFMAEILLYYSSGDYKFCAQRCKRFIKQYKTLLAKRDYEAERLVTDIVTLLLAEKGGKKIYSAALRQQIAAFTTAKTNPAVEDTQLINYKGWINQFAVQARRK
jgi:hypothetical protein